VLLAVTGQREVEMFLDENGLPFTAFRPQVWLNPQPSTLNPKP